MLQKPNYQHIYAIISKSYPPILIKLSEDVHLTQRIENQLSKQTGLKLCLLSQLFVYKTHITL